MSPSIKIFWRVFIFLCFAGIYTTTFAQKNDTVYFMNGDKITGEIKSFKYGYMTHKTYGVSTVNIKLDKISTFYSKKNFEIIFKDGKRRFGSFIASHLDQFVNILTMNDTLLTPLQEIVEITPIKNRFWKRLSGSVDLGYSYTKANKLSQVTFSGNVKYQHKNYFTQLVLNSNITDQEDKAQTNKSDGTFSLYRRLKKSWFAIGSFGGEQNTELGLELRLQGTLGAGNEIVHTNTNNLLAGAAIVVNKEWSVDSTDARINIDGLFMISYRLFRFNDPSIDITSNFNVYPSFTVAGRWRVDYDIKVKIEIISDLYFSLSFYDNYDSKPASADASKNDFGVTTSIGYTF